MLTGLVDFGLQIKGRIGVDEGNSMCEDRERDEFKEQ